MKKKRIVIELNISEYETADFVKRVVGVEWKDVLLLGIVKLTDTDLWKEVEKKIDKEIKKLKKEG